MIEATIHLGESSFSFDGQKPIDISIPLREGLSNVNCFWSPPVQIEPVRMGSFVGDVREGGSVNFKNVRLNPHGNGTHTECVGHISPNGETIAECLKQYFFTAALISLYPQRIDSGDRLIFTHQIEEALGNRRPQAVIIRTLPNDDLKLITQYSGSNPPYLHHEATLWLAQNGVEHLLLDLPSVDREEDGGKLLAHRAFWQYPSDSVRFNATITELIYVPNTVKDGDYILNLQITSLILDATPSKPVLYAIKR